MMHAGFKTLMGFAAGSLTTLAYLPQVMKAWKSRSTRDISAGMFIILSMGLALWTIYGFLINSLPVIITNIVSLALAVAILVFKIVNG